MFKKSYSLLILLGMFVASSMLQMNVAQAADAVSIGVVDVQRIMRDAKSANSARKQLDSMQSKFKTQTEAQEKTLQKEEQELSKQRSVLSQKVFEEKAKSFREKVMGVQKEVQGKRVKLGKAYDAAVSEIQKQMQDIITEISKEKKYTLMLPTSQVLYFADGMDSTDEVLKRLDAKLPSLTVSEK